MSYIKLTSLDEERLIVSVEAIICVKEVKESILHCGFTRILLSEPHFTVDVQERFDVVQDRIEYAMAEKKNNKV